MVGQGQLVHSSYAGADYPGQQVDSRTNADGSTARDHRIRHGRRRAPVRFGRHRRQHHHRCRLHQRQRRWHTSVALLAHLDHNGKLLWQKEFGDTGEDKTLAVTSAVQGFRASTKSLMISKSTRSCVNSGTRSTVAVAAMARSI